LRVHRKNDQSEDDKYNKKNQKDDIVRQKDPIEEISK
jgi:hypothetical protein